MKRIAMAHDSETKRSGGSEATSNDADDCSITITYLRRMIYYAEALAQHEHTRVGDDGESLVNTLARELLVAADPYNLRSSLKIPAAFLLPEKEEETTMMNGTAARRMHADDDDDDDIADDDDDDDEEDNLPYKVNPLKVKGGRPRDPTRIDALRSLLRSMAPVALDVATRVACHVLMLNETSSIEKGSNNGMKNATAEGEKDRLQAFVLFGLWIPLAPQLAPVISDLFGEFQRRFGGVGGEGNPLALLPFLAQKKLKLLGTMDTTAAAATAASAATIMQLDNRHDHNIKVEDAEAAVVASEAAHDMLNVFCCNRYENVFVRRWWDWDSCLFILIRADDDDDDDFNGRLKLSPNNDADGDVVMDSTHETLGSPIKDVKENNLNYFIGGYSPETNASHCATRWKNPTFQMKWHASRAVGALFALRPLPLSNFLKTVGVHHNDVPFVRHPWTIHMEDAAWENSLIHKVARVVLPRVETVGIKFGHNKNEAFACYEGSTDSTSIEVTEDEDEETHGVHTFKLPSITDVRRTIPLHPSLIQAGRGILLPRRGSVASYHEWCQSSLTQDDTSQQSEVLLNSTRRFIPTATTMRNISLLGIAMSSDPHPPPILVCGPPGSGKSSLVREISRLCSSFGSPDPSTQGSNRQEDDLLELHVDEETDSKTLLGSYVATDIPGEFLWMAGPLTSAARLGRWVLIEDLDRCPEEIQAALIRLFEERILPLGVGKEERCHPRFRLFGTLVTAADSTNARGVRRKSLSSLGAGGKRILHPNLWRKVHVDPLPFAELREVGRMLHPHLPHSVADAALAVLRKLDVSGRGDDDEFEESIDDLKNSTRIDKDILGHGARHASVREYIKLLSRISSAVKFEPGSDYATESQRLICLADTVDVFAMSCPCLEKRRNFISQIGAPAWGLTADAAIRYIESRIPALSYGGHNNRCIDVGRARLVALKWEDDENDMASPGKKRNFAETNHALRLMESVAVCALQNEPALLVGETGCGKTTLVQRLANLTGRSLLVQNLSLQTDSTDLLGGYKPLEMRHVARGVYDKFVDLFVSSFSRSQNAQFLKYVLSAFEKGDWKKLAQCFLKAAGMGENKMRESCRIGEETTNLDSWADFRSIAERFERQRMASESGLAFLFTEGALVDAIRTGKWVLLDEINLASSETLQRLCGLLDDSHGSITLTEKGDATAVSRHPDFRLFAAMNPATDAGKKDLPSSIRSRFTELYVDELLDPVQLRSVAARYLDGAVTTNGVHLEHSESVISSVELYLQCRLLSDQYLVDGGGQKPRYTMRTMCRTLSAARNLIIQQRFAPQRAILEGFQLAFENSLDMPSRDIIKKQFATFLPDIVSQKERDHPGRRPDGRNGSNSYELIKPFWIKSGNEEQMDWADPSTSSNGKPKFVLTPSSASNLRRLGQAVASGPWSILLEGPTSAGKTTLVEYLAARCGHRCVRINNHEHTDIQEYTGSYAADSKGKISFQEGILVQALRKGHWVILDELNLAPSEVLEALNRLLDDNRELYLPEINEAVKPHQNFRLFATQNPAGAYGGRKPLSRAFRNRFVEIHMSDIPEDEMIVILERRCGCPPSHAKLLVRVMKSLRQRRSRTGIFRGKDGLITPRDLLRWAGRGSLSKTDLAMEGYMLLAERLRVDEEKDVVRSVIEREFKVTIDVAEAYYGDKSEGRALLEHALRHKSTLSASGLNVKSIAPTQSMMRLLTLVMRCVKQKEPVLLVGDTGCGKTTVVQLLSIILQRQLTVVNCHAGTETSDIIGGFRPVRGRQILVKEMIEKAVDFVQHWSDSSFNINDIAPHFIHNYSQLQHTDLPQDAPTLVFEFIRELRNKCRHSNRSSTVASQEELSSKKRRKLSNGNVTDSTPTSTEPDSAHHQRVEIIYQEIEGLYQKYSSLFEWADGPIVCSMKNGSLLLLDEMSLAEDAVLERLNSVLEPSRTLTLAERGGEGPACAHDSDDSANNTFSSEIRAHDDFRIFATMNPGGDFGKRELSPALRSRFTEIWVPSVSYRLDIDLVLERSFASAVEQNSMHNFSNIAAITEMRRMMLDYFDWFNVEICDDPNSFCNDFKLSLRDMLSWARFIADVVPRNKVSQYSSYVHGASLMHLDGLGLGTGVSNQDAAGTRNRAKAFLQKQIASHGAADVAGFQDELHRIKESMVTTRDCFGIDPFTIPTGVEQIPVNLGFNLMAPTTGLNLRRVLRGMQISKPILLEGSPGVGKTSLISALAKASGHNLVRINLSEQTDISDLMGNDLPHSGDGDNDGSSSSASFRWCDGVLLKAIKRGDWVLLDELNLASQSVLEGLNSCLDHRASVYIPELGREFACPPTFRIFAAQNPLSQGCGRKGLPKSFLNRFTKVYIEALTKEDLFSIVATQFPSIPGEIVEKMIYFNEGVQRDIDSGLYGQHGSPWEFNLRDIFRWCQLLQNSGCNISSDLAAKYADMLYTQRLRTDHDRSLIKKRFNAHFSISTKKSYIKLDVTEEYVLVGSTLLERFPGSSHWSDVPTQENEPGISQALLRPMEAVACCIRMNWPCLLVGPTSSGKSALLKTLGDACNVHIETLAMSSSTDVTELIGCFEQTDALGCMKILLKSMKQIYDGSCLIHSLDVGVLHRISKHYWVLNEETLKLGGAKLSVPSNRALLLAIDQLVECYENLSRLNTEFSESFSDQIASARRWLSSLNAISCASQKSPFQWMDGILVQAMEHGYWLHLENVNFCPSSVLDRLNPLMEFGGELVMTECGISDEDQYSKPRVIEPHPNFRLFLSMNSLHGEISRAMRNRCIEVCVLPPTADTIPISDTSLASEVKTIDALTALWDSEVRSHNAGYCMLTAHQGECKESSELKEEPNSIKVLKDWGSLFIGLLKRGMAHSSLSASHQILYGVHDDTCKRMELAPSSSGLIAGISTRRDLGFYPFAAQIVQESRLIKAMAAININHRSLDTLEQFISLKRQAYTCYKLGRQQDAHSKLLYQAICRLTDIAQFNEILLSTFFDGFCTKIATLMKFATLILKGDGLPRLNDDLDSKFRASQSTRLPQLLEESVTYRQLCRLEIVPAPSDMSVIAVSYFVHKKRIDTSTITCPVTPLFFPLFKTIDVYLTTLEINKYTDPRTVSSHKHLLQCRDRLWQCLKRTKYVGARSKSQIGFEFTGFLIQYCWIKKSLAKFKLTVESDHVKIGVNSDSLMRSLLLSFESIDDSIQESTGGSISSSDILWKKCGHPHMPSKLNDYEELKHLTDLSQACTLVNEDLFGFIKMVSVPFAPQIDLKQLVTSNHPSLFVQHRFCSELLGALAMTFWASTDETKGVSAESYSTKIAPQVLRKSFADSEADFIANIDRATIDTSIRTIDNALDMEAIKNIVGDHKGKTLSSDLFIKSLLSRFGEIQASQIGEIWCISEEVEIIGRLTEVLRRYQRPACAGIREELRSLRHKIKSFTKKTLAHTQWPIDDLRPYLTLLWALDSEPITDATLFHLMCSILHRMLYSFYNHQWCNTYNDLDCISPNLLGPSLWNKEDSETPVHTNTSFLGQYAKNIILSSCAGPSKIGMNVSRSAIFRLLRIPAASSAYMTMENSDARKEQAKKLFHLFASQEPLAFNAYQVEMIKYSLGSVLYAFQDDFRHLLDFNSIKISDIEALFKNYGNKSMKVHLNSLMVPLIENIQAMDVSKVGTHVWKRHVARAWIYLGSLRLSLLVPSSPIDPGRKPAAKVEQLDWFLQEINSNLLSHCLHFGLSYGDFAPDSHSTRHFCALSDTTSKKRTDQEKKIIVRPSNAPQFFDLFREIHHFCKTVASPSSVLALADIIEKGDSNFRAQEVNWQCSATSFCTRLSTVYSMYEDITIPCINEIRAIQLGLRQLALNQVESPQTRLIVITQDELLKYPFGSNQFICQLTKECCSHGLKELLIRFGAGEGSGRKEDTVTIHRSIQLASLMLVQLDQMMNHHELVIEKNLHEVNSIFSSLAHLPEVTVEKDDSATSNRNLSEVDIEFRDYFPDHGAEFERIIAMSLDNDCDCNEEVDKDKNMNSVDVPEISQLSDAELSLAVSLHKELFSERKRNLDDDTRLRAFRCCYEAASHLGHLTEWMEKSQGDSSHMGSHLLALALRCNVNRSSWTSMLGNESIKDFHNDPFPSESIRADLPLRNLLIRVGQLLRAFPGHAVLVVVGQVVERVRQLDIQAVALGKVMSGLEVILRKSQDWEQHASQHVTLGKPLQDISALVASWRKLELQSWSYLLTMRENRRSRQVFRHWPRLYSLIHNLRDSSEASNAPSNKDTSSSPKWVWKGYPKLSASSGIDVNTKGLDDLAKVLDTFVLTSNIAEFNARLDLIESFAKELRNECEANGSKRCHLARLLQALCNHYNFFAPLLMQTKDKLREPIEKRLKDEVKLAKWDEQSYYSLAESSEKNHRKLMKFLRDYDEALDTTVLTVLEQNFAEGIRSSNQTQLGDHEPTTTVPGNSSLFPELFKGETTDKPHGHPPSHLHALTFTRKGDIKHVSPDDWLAAGLTDPADKYVLRINHYARRMESIIPHKISYAYDAAIIAAEMADAIFMRINTLRETKTTKQVKQRALVDLFKCLKDQGYCSMKWSVPSSIRDPHAILQLPVPSFGSLPWDKSAPDTLEKGEYYFHRCQVEITRLRFEISMIGSQYMSLREMTLMQGYSEYILFMICQQRCSIATMIQSVASIESSIHSYDGLTDSMPFRQTNLSNNTISFEKHLFSLIEGLHQTALLIKESLPLVQNDAQRDNARDTVAILTSCASTLEENYAPCKGEMPITYTRIHHISTRMTNILDDAKSKVLSCMKVCGGALPTSIFDSCMVNVDQALNLALSYDEVVEESKLPPTNRSELLATVEMISSVVQSTLIAVQGSALSATRDQCGNEKVSTVCGNHKEMLEEFHNFRLERINHELSAMSRALIGLHDDASTNAISRSFCTRATISSLSLVQNVLQLTKAKLGDALIYYLKHSKLLYVLLRVFRVLISKGFCSDDVSDGGEGDGSGGAGQMKFEDDVDGTGMGEGEGKKDVTDELDNEEQLLGLKGDEDQEASSAQERKELKEDEVDTGMEMEQDFEGENYDLPDQPDQKDDTNSDNEEELDREMGAGEDPNEQVVDEKIWDNDEDDLKEMQQENEKFEENSKMAGEKLEDEMRTGDGEDDKDDPNSKGSQEDSNQKDTPQYDSTDDKADQLDELINDDTEDKYEDKNVGVEVRNEDQSGSGEEEEDGVDINDLNLDDGDEDSTGAAEDAARTDESDVSIKPDNEEVNPDADENANTEEDAAAEGGEETEEPDAMEKVGEGGAGVDDNDLDEPEDNANETSIAPSTKSQYDSNEALGVAAIDGQDTVKETNEESPDTDKTANEGGAAEENKGEDEKATDESKGDGGTGNDGNWQRGKAEDRNDSQNESFDDVPNPFRSPGDAEKFWHKKLDMIQDSQQDQEQPTENIGQAQQDEIKEKDGQFEYTKDGEDNCGQVLGIAEEDQAKQLEDRTDDDFEHPDQEGNKTDMDIDSGESKQKREQSHSSSSHPNKDISDSADDSEDKKDQQQTPDERAMDTVNSIADESIIATNRASTDMTQLQNFGSDDEDNCDSDGNIDEIEVSGDFTLEDIENARAYWQLIQSDTNNLSRRLCEKLRLVMEPLVATKLRGDYRTGKRVNMKRIIGYIASGYRKDKIWLRRTKPAKRDYRVLIAVDDSESMQKSQAGDMALRALATLANGMSQLEIGQLGIASFGEDMKLLHPFNIPFTSESGVNVVSNFNFDAKRTRTALCVESSIAALEGARSVSSSMQLVFMISDGRIERDSRSKLRRLIRQMAENNMLMVMIIVEGEENGSSSKSSESILNMKEVSFVNGKPKIKHFIEDYPFPYYLVVADLAALPEILGDCLRQWFEMLAQIQNAA